MKKFFIILILLTFALCVYADEQYVKKNIDKDYNEKGGRKFTVKNTTNTHKKKKIC